MASIAASSTPILAGRSAAMRSIFRATRTHAASQGALEPVAELLDALIEATEGTHDGGCVVRYMGRLNGRTLSTGGVSGMRWSARPYSTLICEPQALGSVRVSPRPADQFNADDIGHPEQGTKLQVPARLASHVLDQGDGLLVDAGLLTDGLVRQPGVGDSLGDRPPDLVEIHWRRIVQHKSRRL